MFIGGFILAALFRSQTPALEPSWCFLSMAAKQCLSVTLFLIGSGLSRQRLKQTELRRPFKAPFYRSRSSARHYYSGTRNGRAKLLDNTIKD